MKNQRLTTGTVNPIRIIYNILEEAGITENQNRQGRENSTYRVFWTILVDILGALSLFVTLFAWLWIAGIFS